MLFKRFQMRRILDYAARFAGKVIDVRLAFLHPLDITLQRCQLLRVVPGLEKQQRDDLVLIIKVERDAFFYHLAELAPELQILVVLLIV